MKGVGFWFSLSLPEERPWPQALSQGILFHSPVTNAAGQLSFHCLTESPHNILFIFITFSHYQLLSWACPKSHLNSLLSLVIMLPRFYNYLVLSSIASVKAPQLWSLTIPRDLPYSWRISHPLEKGKIWLVCGSTESFPIPHNHYAASSPHYSASKSSQRAAHRCSLLGACRKVSQAANQSQSKLY